MTTVKKKITCENHMWTPNTSHHPTLHFTSHVKRTHVNDKNNPIYKRRGKSNLCLLFQHTCFVFTCENWSSHLKIWNSHVTMQISRDKCWVFTCLNWVHMWKKAYLVNICNSHMMIQISHVFMWPLFFTHVDIFIHIWKEANYMWKRPVHIWDFIFTWECFNSRVKRLYSRGEIRFFSVRGHTDPPHEHTTAAQFKRWRIS